jgi:hypothetical protein
MKSRTQGEDPAARAQRERERRLAELGGIENGMESADGLTEDLRKVYGLRRLGRPGAASTPGVQPAAAPMPIVPQSNLPVVNPNQPSATPSSGTPYPGMTNAPKKAVVSGGFKTEPTNFMDWLWRSIGGGGPTVSPTITTSTAPTTKTQTMSQSKSSGKKK